MADLCALERLDKITLAELVSVLAGRLGGLDDRALAEARWRAATRRAARSSEVRAKAIATYSDAQSYLTEARAKGLPVGRLSEAVSLARLAFDHANRRDVVAWQAVGHAWTAMMEERR